MKTLITLLAFFVSTASFAFNSKIFASLAGSSATTKASKTAKEMGFSYLTGINAVEPRRKENCPKRRCSMFALTFKKGLSLDESATFRVKATRTGTRRTYKLLSHEHVDTDGNPILKGPTADVVCTDDRGDGFLFDTKSEEKRAWIVKPSNPDGLELLVTGFRWLRQPGSFKMDAELHDFTYSARTKILSYSEYHFKTYELLETGNLDCEEVE